MRITRIAWHLCFIFTPTLILFAIAWAGKSAAWDLHGKPFGFPLQFTEDRTTNFFPAAHPILALNPAGDDFTREPPFDYNVLAGLVSENGHFGAGGGVTINSAIALTRLPAMAAPSRRYWAAPMSTLRRPARAKTSISGATPRRCAIAGTLAPTGPSALRSNWCKTTPPWRMRR